MDALDSGLDPPPAAPIGSVVEADVTLDSGLDPPPSGDAISNAGGSATEGASVAARTVRSTAAPKSPTAKIRHAATVRVTIRDPHPFSVQIESAEAIEIISVEVSILSDGKRVFNTELGAGSPMTMVPDKPRVLTLSAQQLAGAEPDLKIGNIIQVKVVYDVPQKAAQIKLSIIGQG